MVKSAPGDIQFKTAMETAVRILTRRNHTSHEVSLKLKKRKVEKKIADRVIAECTRLNYLDDENTARMYVEELKKKGYGRRYIRSAMRRKGLLAETIEISVGQGVSDSEERENAARLVEKRRGAFSNGKDVRREKAKIYRYLYNRGFSAAIISEVVKGLK